MAGMAKLLKALSGKDRQNFLALLNIVEADGVTDIRFVRAALQESINDEYRQRRAVLSRDRQGFLRDKMAKAARSGNRYPAEVDICPSCGVGRMYPAKGRSGEPLPEDIWGCHVCRYSEMRGE